ncbi:hypothetical protein GPECTOR_4g819 [Gonium pectorale]|uniref:Calcineurin-like phosphoesterase domain-containing protein n=1 Tax=Gonium pectorale TaxID=33097 RepID=A0A150GY39_GONPE|nr:hypothetical protein GPECTOR_4g819 [Gonium pectorale]|eukprot:KXZ54749.1 hypothetical protein GPECTOR_4g819 [Gonium pectorale]
MAWLHRLSTTAFRRDVLIVAGDVSDDLQELRYTLTVLKRRFAIVFFCPGNHELWVHGHSSRPRTDVSGAPAVGAGAEASASSRTTCPQQPQLQPPPIADSVSKLAAVMAAAEECGALVGPARLGRLRVVPLLAWHHKAFDTEPDIPGIPRASSLTISDYARCVWPQHIWRPADGYSSNADRPCDADPDSRDAAFSASASDASAAASSAGIGAGVGDGGQGSCEVAAWFDGLNDAPRGWRGILGSGSCGGGGGVSSCESGPGPPPVSGTAKAAAPSAPRAPDTGADAGARPGGAVPASAATTADLQRGEGRRGARSNGGDGKRVGGDISGAGGDGGGDDLISFSHFLPLQSLLPEKRFLTYPNLAKAVGSTYLGERVRRLGPQLHIFGHTHFAWDAVHQGVRYIQAPLAYPSERRFRLRTLLMGPAEAGPQAWEGEAAAEVEADSAAPQAAGGAAEAWPSGAAGDASDAGWLPLCVYRAHYKARIWGGCDGGDGGSDGGDGLPTASMLLEQGGGDGCGSPTGGGGGDGGGPLPSPPRAVPPAAGRSVEVLEWRAEWCPQQQASWSRYYDRNPRRPEDIALAPWVAERYSRRRRRRVAEAAAKAAGAGAAAQGSDESAPAGSAPVAAGAAATASERRRVALAVAEAVGEESPCSSGSDGAEEGEGEAGGHGEEQVDETELE